ncbi:Hypothetical predicted protein [Paramuricea clavata]|uniref:Uncharacterized protein n=1 Tax=Paramuricea clavata TaxID=317549 RepID=A0A6S7G6E0_PARCT|nr:Hypothetical predicted protein [Paramuricea clavata]
MLIPVFDSRNNSRKTNNDLTSSDSDDASTVSDVENINSSDPESLETLLTDDIGLTNPESHEITVGKYYGVFYPNAKGKLCDNAFFIGKCVSIEDEDVKFAWLKLKSLANWSFCWPKKADIELLDPRFIFAGPLRIIGTPWSGYTFPEIDKVIMLYKEVQNHWKSQSSLPHNFGYLL